MSRLQTSTRSLAAAAALAAAVTFALPGASRAQATAPLQIDPPPGATVTLEVDARDGDVLGLAKQLIAGVRAAYPVQQQRSAAPAPLSNVLASSENGPIIRIGGAKPQAKPGAPPPHNPVVNPVTGAVVPAASAPSSDPAAAAAPTAAEPSLGPITLEQLSALIKDIHHLHVLMAHASAGSATILPFYEDAFRTEGGHRVAWMDSGTGATRVLFTGFDAPRTGFAIVVQRPTGDITIIRADAYPNMDAIAPLIATFLPAAKPAAPAANAAP